MGFKWIMNGERAHVLRASEYEPPVDAPKILIGSGDVETLDTYRDIYFKPGKLISIPVNKHTLPTQFLEGPVSLHLRSALAQSGLDLEGGLHYNSAEPNFPYIRLINVSSRPVVIPAGKTLRIGNPYIIQESSGFGESTTRALGRKINTESKIVEGSVNYIKTVPPKKNSNYYRGITQGWGLKIPITQRLIRRSDKMFDYATQDRDALDITDLHNGTNRRALHDLLGVHTHGVQSYPYHIDPRRTYLSQTPEITLPPTVALQILYGTDKLHRIFRHTQSKILKPTGTDANGELVQYDHHIVVESYPHVASVNGAVTVYPTHIICRPFHYVVIPD